MLTVVAYDCPDDRRRDRLASTVADFGQRVQGSVYECHLEPSDITRLVALLRERIDPATDRVRIYRVCKACEQQVASLGVDPYEGDTVAIIV